MESLLQKVSGKFLTSLHLPPLTPPPIPTTTSPCFTYCSSCSIAPLSSTPHFKLLTNNHGQVLSTLTVPPAPSSALQHALSHHCHIPPCLITAVADSSQFTGKAQLVGNMSTPCPRVTDCAEACAEKTDGCTVKKKKKKRTAGTY